MKKLFFILMISIFSQKVFADDVTATIVNSEIGVNNGSITLTVSAGFAPFNFLWSGPSGFVSTEQNISDLEAGEYCVTVTDNFCGAATLCVIVEEAVQNPIQMISVTALSVFPNPFDAGFTISLILASPGELNISLTDMLGNTIVSKQKSIPAGENKISFELEYPIAAGDYLLTVTDNKSSTFTHQILHLK